MRYLVLMLMTILLQPIAGCSYQGTQVWYEVDVEGPIRIMWEVGYPVATGDNGFLFHTRNDDPMTLSLRQVREYQLVTISVDVRRRDAGFHFNSFNPNDGDIIARALWVLSEPYRSNFELSIDPDLDPAELRLHVDRDDDGIADVELPPHIAVTGESLEMATLYWNLNSAVAIERVAPNQASITLDYPRDVQGSYAGPLQEILYAVYPDRPELQKYDGPFMVEAGSTVQYRILFESGFIGVAPELPIR